MSKLKAKSPDVVEPGKTKGLIFGASGVGKTWFTLSFPAPYYMDTEGGADLRHYQERLKSAGGVYMGPEDGTLDFQTVIEQMQALATEKHQYKTLIIDSITKLYQTAIANEQERLGTKDAFGASKKPAIAGMRRLINWAMKLDMNIWFVAHEIPEWGENPKTGQREEIGKLPDVWDKLVYELHLAMRIIRRGKDYPATAIVHKSRLLGFPLSDSFPLEYSGFAERYGKDYIEAASKTISLASAQQVTDIKHLVDVLKVSEEEIEKLMTKAGADKWEEFSIEQAEKTLVWLNKKIKGEK
ncbi:MAG: AAA family ATPase [Planctomycetes bacterium]|nr:AAA family ATPase [Planctomycetota bacterium]